MSPNQTQGGNEPDDADEKQPMDEKLKSFLKRLERADLRRSILPFEGPTGPTGRLDGREYIVLCGNDYLGLAGDPRLAEAAHNAIAREGFGTGAARLVSGSRTAHHELEEALARFKRAEACLLFNSGYTANVGVVPALTGPGGVIYSDALNHASIIDGARLSRAGVRVIRHNDPGHLEGLLSGPDGASPDADGERPVRRLIVTEGVFSMEGDLAPLDRVVPLARRHGAAVMVDDAHGTGVLGEGGRGTASRLGVDSLIDIQMGTLGKAFGAFGAYVCGSRALIDYLINTCRSFIYSTSLPASVAAGAREGLRIVESEPDRIERLHRNIDLFREGLRALGYAVRPDPTPIIPVVVGDVRKALALAEGLLERGVFARAIRPPTVPQGTARVRVTVSSTHQTSHLERALDAFEQAGRTLGLLASPVSSAAPSGQQDG